MTKLEEITKAMKTAREAKIQRPLSECYEDMARAAIEALREPSQWMIDAGWLQVDWGYDQGGDYGPYCCWKVMVDAIFEEEPE